MPHPTRPPRYGYNQLDRSHPHAQGLRGWWPLQEGGSVLARDWSGWGNHGELQNGADWDAGVSHDFGTTVDQSCNFPGTTDHVLIKNNDALNGATMNGITLMAWYRRDGQPGIGYGRILHKSNGSTSDSWSLTHSRGGTGRAYFRMFSGGAVRSFEDAGEAFATNGWYHFVATYDNVGDVYLYLFGVGVSSWLGGGYGELGDHGVDKVSIGKHADSTTRDIDGAIADARVYDHALDIDEINDIMRNPWASLRPIRRRVYFAAAGGPTTYDVATVSSASFTSAQPAQAAMSAGHVSSAALTSAQPAQATMLAGHTSSAALTSAQPAQAAMLAGHVSSAALTSAQPAQAAMLGDHASSLVFTDSQTSLIALLGSVTDNVNLTTAQAVRVVFAALIAESLGVASTDSATAVFSAIQSSNLVFTENTFLDGTSLAGSVTESLALTDSPSVISVIASLVIEALNSNSVQSGQANFLANTVETATLDSLQSAVAQMLASSTQGLSLVDVITTGSVLPGLVATGFNLSTAQGVLANYNSESLSALAFSDNLSAQMQAVAAMVENFAVVSQNIGQALMLANIDVSLITNVTVSGAILNFSITTPEERIYYAIDLRTFEVQEESRTFEA